MSDLGKNLKIDYAVSNPEQSEFEEILEDSSNSLGTFKNNIKNYAEKELHKVNCDILNTDKELQSKITTMREGIKSDPEIKKLWTNYKTFQKSQLLAQQKRPNDRIAKIQLGLYKNCSEIKNQGKLSLYPGLEGFLKQMGNHGIDGLNGLRTAYSTHDLDENFSGVFTAETIDKIAVGCDDQSTTLIGNLVSLCRADTESEGFIQNHEKFCKEYKKLNTILQPGFEGTFNELFIKACVFAKNETTKDQAWYDKYKYLITYIRDLNETGKLDPSTQEVLNEFQLFSSSLLTEEGEEGTGEETEFVDNTPLDKTLEGTVADTKALYIESYLTSVDTIDQGTYDKINKLLTLGFTDSYITTPANLDRIDKIFQTLNTKLVN